MNVNPQTNLANTQEMYLKAVLECEELGVPPLRARITERLGHSGPTVSQTVARLVHKNLCTLDEDAHIVLTRDGRATAARVLYAHRIIECFLADIIGLDWTELHSEACRWEHVASPAAIDRIARLVQHRALDPYGNRISRDGRVWARPSGVVTVGELAPGQEVHGVLTRLAESAQAEGGFLSTLTGIGVRMRSPVVIRASSRGVFSLRARESDAIVVIPRHLKSSIFVDPRERV